nr:archaeosortase/exosortase family protein [Moorena sp. SIO3H5]
MFWRGLLGLGLLASGLKGLKQYWQHLTIFLCLAIPSGLPTLLIDVSTLTAKFSGLLLWYSGFEVSRQGVYLILPTVGALVSGALFITIWKSTPWARRKG